MKKCKRVTTGNALFASSVSALFVLVIHWIAHSFFFNNPALVSLNNTEVGITLVVVVFLISFIGMKWESWF